MRGVLMPISQANPRRIGAVPFSEVGGGKLPRRAGAEPSAPVMAVRLNHTTGLPRPPGEINRHPARSTTRQEPMTTPPRPVAESAAVTGAGQRWATPRHPIVNPLPARRTVRTGNSQRLSRGRKVTPLGPRHQPARKISIRLEHVPIATRGTESTNVTAGGPRDTDMRRTDLGHPHADSAELLLDLATIIGWIPRELVAQMRSISASFMVDHLVRAAENKLAVELRWLLTMPSWSA